jgi:hypothetical protein
VNGRGEVGSGMLVRRAVFCVGQWREVMIRRYAYSLSYVFAGSIGT